MDIEWRSPRVIGVSIAVVVLVLVVSQRAFWSWALVNYVELGIAVALVLVGVTAAKLLQHARRG